MSITSKQHTVSDEGTTGNGHFEHEHGIHWIIAAVLIVAEMAGGGLIALPGSLVDSVLIIISAIFSGYTGIQLGENWTMMQERWPEYRRSCRKPYPEMAFRALGGWARVALSIIISVQQFSASVIYLLLASNNIASLLFDLFSIKLNFCYVALIVTAFILPLLMLGTPKDFWQAAVVASLSTSVAVALIFVAAAHDQKECMTEVEYPPVVFEKFFLAYGAIMFAYGGHVCFPTFQHDMKRPADFTKSVIAGYIVIVIIYLPLSVYGYLVYGGSLSGGSIIPSLQLKWAQTGVNILITLHAIFTEIIGMSPFTLTMEDLFRIPNQFGIRRAILRTIILLCILFMALSVPKFGPILDLIGGSTITLMTMILPGVFSVSLIAGKIKRDLNLKYGNVSDSDDALPSLYEVVKLNNPWLLLLNFVIIAFGLIGGVASTISAVNELVSTTWDAPCYVQLITGTLGFDAGSGLVNCCGQYKNITTVVVPIGEPFCSVTGQ